MDILHARITRWILAALIVFRAASDFFAPALMLAYRLHSWGIAKTLGGFTPGDDYRRFVPLMDATPAWLHALWVVAGALYLISAWRILRNNNAAFSLFITALALDGFGWLISQSMPSIERRFPFLGRC